MRAHSKLTESGDASFYSQSTSEVAQRALRESNEDSNGERDNDAITKPYKPRSNEVMFMVFLVI
jgi:stress response protein SCP2